MSAPRPERRAPPPFDLGFGVNVPAGPTLEQAAEVARALAGALAARVHQHVHEFKHEPSTLTLWEVACLERMARLAEAVAPHEKAVKETIVRGRKRADAARADVASYARRPAA